jgi:AsmA protein
MKRLALGVGLLFGVAATVAAFSSWTLRRPSIGERVTRQISDASGLAVASPARITFSLLPRPRLEFETLTAQDTRVSLAAPEGTGDLRIMALLSGHVELASITLFHPTVTVDLDGAQAPAGGNQPGGPAPSDPSWIRTAPAKLGELVIVDGSLSLRSARRRLEENFASIDGQLDWQAPDSPAALTLSGQWRNQTVELTGWLSDPAVVANGGDAPAKFEIETNLLSAKFDGSLWGGRTWRLEGAAEAATESVRELERWIGLPYRSPRAFGAAALSGRFLADRQGATVSDLALSLAGSELEGEAAWSLTSAKPILSATLASDKLDLTPFLAEMPPLSDADGAWSDRPLPSVSGSMNLDLRVSAAHARLDRVELTDMGLSVLLENGRLDVSLPEAKAYGGRLAGRLAVSQGADGTTIDASGNLQHVDLGDFLWATRDFGSLTGSATGKIAIAGHGSTVQRLVRGLTGDADFLISDGEIVGVNFEQALRRVDKRPLSVGSEVHGGRTPFSKLSGRLTIADDSAQLVDAVITGPGAKIELSGSTRLDDRSLSLKAAAQQAGADGTVSVGGSRLTLNVAGYWDDPRLVLDAEGLVRRSEAAAPLFGSSAVALPASTR